MRTFIFVSFLLLLVSCSNNVKNETIHIAEKPLDSLAEEIYESDAYDMIGWEIMGNEKFGELQLGLDTPQIITILGIPDQKTKEEYWGADGGYHSDWIYEKEGVILHINKIEEHPESEQYSKFIFAITIQAPSKLTTSRGIGIQSSITQVRNAYRKAIENPEINDGGLIAGTLYGGLAFDFKDGSVEKLFLGAMAE